MNQFLFILGLLAFLVLPFLPAWRVYRKGLDAQAPDLQPDLGSSQGQGHVPRKVVIEASQPVLSKVHASQFIQVKKGATLGWAQAPSICFAIDEGTALAHLRKEGPAALLEGLALQRNPNRYVSLEDIVVPAHATVYADIVSKGSVRVEEGATVYGSIRAQGWATLEAGSAIKGSVVAKDVCMGSHCEVWGSVLAENEALVFDHCRIGRLEALETLSARKALIAPNSTVYGAVTVLEGCTCAEHFVTLRQGLSSTQHFIASPLQQ